MIEDLMSKAIAMLTNPFEGFYSLTSRFALFYLLPTYLFVLVFFWYTRRKIGDILPTSIWRHRSAVMDYKLYFIT